MLNQRGNAGNSGKPLLFYAMLVTVIGITVAHGKHNEDFIG